MRARAWVALLALATASCATPLMKLPAGAGDAAPDATDALHQALSSCQPIRTMTAEVAVRGTVVSRRLRARLLAGLSAPASAYLEAPAPFGAPVFIFAAVDDDATLLLPRDRRVLQHGRPAEVIEAIAGVPLSPTDLRAVMTGCATTTAGEGQRVGEDWRVFPGAETLYLRREKSGAAWQLVAVLHRGNGGEWRAEYRDFLNGLPRTVRLASTTTGRFDLTLTLSQLETNVPIEAKTFHIDVPRETSPLTIDELRQSGPLAEQPEKSK